MNYIIRDLISDTGRVRKKQFISFINSSTLKEFCAAISKPLLVSRVLHDGQLEKTKGTTGTLRFNVKKIREEFNNPDENKNASSIPSAIFILKKNPDAITPAHSISIGRVIPNDLIIPDYTVSRRHATVITHHREYYIYDHDSTNGTLVAESPVSKSKPLLLEIGDTITIGRLGFVFLSPERVYHIFFCVRGFLSDFLSSKIGGYHFSSISSFKGTAVLR